jgi:hypothetical protein
LRVVEANEAGKSSNCYRDPRFDRDLHLIAWPIRDWLTVFNQAFGNHLDNSTNILERLLLRVAPGSSALAN